MGVPLSRRPVGVLRWLCDVDSIGNHEYRGGKTGVLSTDAVLCHSEWPSRVDEAFDGEPPYKNNALQLSATDV